MKNITWVLFIILIVQACEKNQKEVIIPVAPTDLYGSSISDFKIKLLWIDKSTNEDGFKVERKDLTGSFREIATVGKDITQYLDSGLTSNTNFTYRIFSFNTAGKSLNYSNEVTIATSGTPLVTTSVITDFNSLSAIAGGSLTNNGNSPITDRGLVWSVNPNPNLNNANKISLGSGSNQFTSEIAVLDQNTSYFVKAYATNSYGTGYGNEVSFKTKSLSLENGLIAFYPFNGNAADSSGFNNNGTVNGAILSTDRFNSSNKAYKFNGTNSTINIAGNSLCTPTNSVSICFWTNVLDWMNNGGYYQATIIEQGAQNYYHCQIGPQNTSPTSLSSINFQFNNRAYSSSPKINFERNKWNQVTFTLTNGMGRFYLNGAIVDSTTGYQYGNPGCPVSFTLGKEFGYYLNGSLDEIRFYSRALNGEEVKYLATH